MGWEERYTWTTYGSIPGSVCWVVLAVTMMMSIFIAHYSINLKAQ